MKLPAIQGVIDRRILANFRIDPEVMAAALPAPFRPVKVGGYAIGGICLIRLKHIRPAKVPGSWGVRSENAAHRIAVEWDEGGETREGVYIPRRDTNSRLNAWAGGRLFPGVHHHARFEVEEAEDRLSVDMRSDDGKAGVSVSGRVVDIWPDGSVFENLAEASAFFERGSLGYSPTRKDGEFDGIELRVRNWEVAPLAVDRIESGYFEEERRFPPGSVEFDCALLMRGIEHEWLGREDLCCAPAAGSA